MTSITSARRHLARLDAYARLGILIGVIMPIVSALCYPTYVHQMQPTWVEWTRLTELPFVLCELAIIHVAIRRGYSDTAIWAALPRDVRWASGLLFVGLSVSSLTVSKNVPASLMYSLIAVIHLRFCAAVYFCARSEPRDAVRSFVPLLGAGLAGLAVLTAWKFLLPPPAASVPGGHIEWASALPGFISVRHFGSWTGAIAAGLMLSLLYGKDVRKGRTAGLYALAVGMTFWSGTRAAVLALAVVALVAMLSLRRLPDRRSLALVAGLSVATLAGALLLLPDDAAFTLFGRTAVGGADAMTSGRLTLWIATFDRWLDAPWFGWGSGSTFWEVDIGWAHTQPHNVILQFLISWGIVGAAGGLWLLGRAIVAVHRRGMADDRLRPLTGVLYSLLFMSLLEGMMHYPRFIMVEMIGIAVILAHRSAERFPTVR